MNLSEWSSNSTEVRKTIPKGEIASENSIKVLGLKWNFQKDILHVRNKISQPNQATKHQIFKATTEVFDPLGLFTPVALRAKLLLRELWEENKIWNNPVNETQLVQWKELLNDFDTLHTITKICWL